MSTFVRYEPFHYVVNTNIKSIQIPQASGMGKGVFGYRLKYAHVWFTSTATVGNRVISGAYFDESNNEMFDMHAGVVQDANRDVHYEMFPGTTREQSKATGSSAVDWSLVIPIPPDFIALPGWSVVFEDIEDIDILDSMVISGLWEVVKL